MESQNSHAEFPATPRTHIEVLRDKDHPRYAEALEAVASRYWPPIYTYLRRQGRNRHDAADITQAFFADVILQRRLFERAEPHRGRLRSLILTALRRYLVDQHRRRSSRQVEIGASMERLDEEEAIASSESSEVAETAFDRRWAAEVLVLALERCKQQFVTRGRGKHWALFEARVLLPSMGGTSSPSLAQAAVAVGFSSPAEAAAALRTVRKRALVLLYQVVAETACGHEDQMAEYELVESLLR